MDVNRIRCARGMAIAALLVAAPVAPAQLGLKLSQAASGYVEVPYHKALLPESGLTVEAWVSYDGTTLQPGWSWPTLCRMNVQPQLESWFLRVDAGMTATRTLRFKVVTQTGAYSASWPFTATQLTTMTHVAGSYDGAAVRLFVNGVEVASAPASGRLVDNGGTLRIGKGDDALGGGEVWNGEIDDFRLWPYGRTAAQIQSTMQVSLNALPGGAHTWTLDGHAFDTSGGLHGTVQGTVPFMSNGLALAPYANPGASAYGNGTTTCTLPLATTIGDLPRVGNAGFGVVCTHAPSNGSGVVAIAARRPASSLPLLGTAVWVDAGGPFATAGVTSGALGAAIAPLPVPNLPFLVTGMFHAQFFWLDQACGPQGLSASDALQVTILP